MIKKHYELNTRPRFITRIDWELLKKQKKTLLKLNKDEHIDGIIALIDSLQDYAVDVMGMSEEEVFN